jgi:HEAT repeat protein
MVQKMDIFKIFLIVIFLIAINSNVLAKDSEAWLSHLNQLGFWEKIKEIKSVSEMPESKQNELVPALFVLLKDSDQSVRLDAAAELAEIQAPLAISHLIENFNYENGEEGMGYIEAVAAFGKTALPQLKKALHDENWLVRTRACDSIRVIDPKMYIDGECKHLAP